jgi:hypothetical protein
MVPWHWHGESIRAREMASMWAAHDRAARATCRLAGSTKVSEANEDLGVDGRIDDA